MKINILHRMVMALVISTLSLAGISIAADGQREDGVGSGGVCDRRSRQLCVDVGGFHGDAGDHGAGGVGYGSEQRGGSAGLGKK